MREWSLRLSDGVQTTIEEWGGTGPIVVGVHGLGSSRRGWARIAEHLRGEFRVVAYDQRGHGDSASARDLRFARSTLDCSEVCDGLGSVHALVGHSWGGAVVIAAGRTTAVKRVVAVDPMLTLEAGVWESSVLKMHRELLAAPLAERETAIRAQNAGLPEVEILAKLHATRRLTIEPIEAIGADNRIDDGAWQHRALLADYPVPLLLAVAGQRRSVFTAGDRAFAVERGGPRVTLTVYEGASHSLQRDAFERFIPDLQRFLS